VHERIPGRGECHRDSAQTNVLVQYYHDHHQPHPSNSLSPALPFPSYALRHSQLHPLKLVSETLSPLTCGPLRHHSDRTQSKPCISHRGHFLSPLTLLNSHCFPSLLQLVHVFVASPILGFFCFLFCGSNGFDCSTGSSAWGGGVFRDCTASGSLGGEGLAMTTGSGRGGGLVVVRRLVVSSVGSL